MSTDSSSNSQPNVPPAGMPQGESAGPPQFQFADRRSAERGRQTPGLERRQFSDSHDSLSADAAALGRAIDQYKLVNRRRYVSYEELLSIVISLGYEKTK